MDDSGEVISFDAALTPGEAATLARWQAEDGQAPAAEEPAEAALPTAEAHQYDLGDIRGDGREYTDADRQADAAIRNWLVEAGLPKGGGDFVIGETKALVPRLQAMNDGERQLFQQQERVRLEAIWKGDFTANLKAARQLVRQIEAKRPGLVEFLEQSGLGDSSAVIMQLHHASQTRRK